jgi:hypothetical protein
MSSSFSKVELGALRAVGGYRQGELANASPSVIAGIDCLVRLWFHRKGRDYSMRAIRCQWLVAQLTLFIAMV